MLANAADFAEREAWPAVLEAEPTAVVLEQALAHPASFLLIEGGNGFEVACPFAPGRARDSGTSACTEGLRSGSRCRMKVCSVRPGHTLIFFYKRSLLPFSRDRLSYGGCEWPSGQLRPEHARAALDYLASGLAPAARPAWLRRALPCTVPD